MRGTVRDAAGAVVSGATVVAVSSGTNQTYRATTDASGRYTLNGIRAGAYAVTITGPSGEVFTRDVTVGIAQSASLDATLGAAAPATAGAASVISAAHATDENHVARCFAARPEVLS